MAKKKSTNKLWGGRFEGGTDPRVEGFTESISCDKRLAPYDIQGSLAHARMLAEVGLITKKDLADIRRGLKSIQKDIDDGNFEWRSDLEDIHTHIEHALVQRAGDAGGKLHTARSRNDQVVTDLKLWLRDRAAVMDLLLADLQRAFVRRAERDRDVILPGYTHLQRAQPVLAGHYLLAWVEKFARDRSRLADCAARADEMPLGAAAMAGTSLPIDRQATQRELGFARRAANSLDVSSDRDFVVEYVFVLALIAGHLSAWAEEWVLWTSAEFSFIELPDAYCTGSSIMPQKKNPDVLELIRGKTGRVYGASTSVLTLIKGLPLAYNRDLQEDKPPLFDAADTVETCLSLAETIVAGSRFRTESIAQRLATGFLDATSLAEYLVLKGVPFRQAHGIVGQTVRLAESRGCALADLSLGDFQHLEPRIEQDVYKVLGAENAVNAFRSDGSTAPREVRKQLRRWKKRLDI